MKPNFISYAAIFAFSIFLMSCRTVVCYGPSGRAKAELTQKEITAEILNAARDIAPSNKLVMRKKTQTAWLYVWTKSRKDIAKQTIRANPNLKLLQVEKSPVLIDDMIVLFAPDLKTVRWMGLEREL